MNVVVGAIKVTTSLTERIVDCYHHFNSFPPGMINPMG